MRLLIALLFLPTIVFAQDRIVEPSQVIDVLNEDLDGDGLLDRAVLYYYSEWDFADLSIYRGTVEGYYYEVSYAPEIAWNGHGILVMPHLEVNDLGSLQVISGNEAAGPAYWGEIVTIAFRGGQYVVAGYTFESYETNNPEAGGTCDVNYLAGRGEFTPNRSTLVEEFRVPKGGIDLYDWSAARVPDRCAAG